MEAIRTNGLLTKGERDNRKIQSASIHGSVFGDGLYTANNPTAFSNYGEVGLLVGRLQGHTVRVPRSLPRNASIATNTIIGDKLLMAQPVDGEGWPTTDSYHEVVLQSSAQCLPMVKYDRVLLQREPDGRKCIQYFQQSLQAILDELFNIGCQRAGLGNIAVGGKHALVRRTTTAAAPAGMTSTAAALGTTTATAGPTGKTTAVTAPAGRPAVPLPHAFPPLAMVPLPTLHPAMAPLTMVPLPTLHPAMARSRPGPGPTAMSAASLLGSSSNIPSTISTVLGNPGRATSLSTINRTHRFSTSSLVYKAPGSLVIGIPRNALIPSPSSCCIRNKDCVICQDALSTTTSAALAVCNHVFHNDCIKQALNAKPECPICRKTVGAPQGKSPSGIMVITTNNLRCSGHHEDSITITYKMKSGPQKTYHDNPGHRQSGKHATAYLPNNADGKNLLKRLKYSFMHGLTFTVGTSATTGIANQCTWSNIHHKTSLSGGIRAHGFPDANYFLNCNKELDGVGVPDAHLLKEDGSDISANV